MYQVQIEIGYMQPRHQALETCHARDDGGLNLDPASATNLDNMEVDSGSDLLSKLAAGGDVEKCASSPDALPQSY